jgi:hypothetical protein
MKALFINTGKSKIFHFFRDKWWLSILFAVFTALWMWPPNFLNTNRVSGKIARVYECDHWVNVTQKGSVKMNALCIILKDSSVYYTVNDEIIKDFQTNNYLERNIRLLYYNQQNGKKGIKKLIIDDIVMLDEDKRLVAIFLIFAIWSIFGVIGEVVRIVKTTPDPKEKQRPIMVNKPIVQKEEPKFHRYTNCPACGYNLKETDKECPDCGLNLS